MIVDLGKTAINEAIVNEETYESQAVVESGEIGEPVVGGGG